MQNADSNYSINPWMNPEVRLGDNVDPSPVLVGDALVAEVVATSPPPPAAGYTPRLIGRPRAEPTINDVLGVGPVGQMREQDAGQPGTMGPSLGTW